ncbi:MAG: hypothetical protein LC790_13820 [Actinobacteria bacterium]|nr:hypothetical protein [Actinomycetota bacterium]
MRKPRLAPAPLEPGDPRLAATGSAATAVEITPGGPQLARSLCGESLCAAPLRSRLRVAAADRERYRGAEGDKRRQRQRAGRRDAGALPHPAHQTSCSATAIASRLSGIRVARSSASSW